MTLSVLLVGLVAFTSTTGAAAVVHAYDGPTTTRVDAHDIAASDAGTGLFSDVWEGSAPPLAEPRRTSTTPDDLSTATNTGGGLRVIGSGFSASERGAAEALAGQGRSVVLRQATGVGRTSDLLVDGIPYDVYTPTTGNLDRIVSAIASKGSQVNGGGVVLDLSKSPLTGVDQGALLARVQGVTSNVSDIIILGG